MNFIDNPSQTSEILLFVIYCVHIFPYMGSASNWILYGLLNTQLQIRHEPQGLPNHHSQTIKNIIVNKTENVISK